MKFELVRDDCKKYPTQEVKIPTRKTIYSAGYDFYSNESIWLYPSNRNPHIFWTDIKAELEPNQYLQISIRSSLASEGLILANGIGIIDSDYYSNESNDGNIGIMLVNIGNNPCRIGKGDRIAQGIILEYHTIEEDNSKRKRIGGIGSTGK